MENLTTTNTQPQYAGFWLRFAATLIDGLIVGAVQLIVVLPIFGVMGLAGLEVSEDMDMENLSGEESLGLLAGMMGSIMIAWLAAFAIQWFYFALMESSSKQATFGKMAVGIKVTDMQGNRISFLRATGRYLGKIISGMILCIGYIMAGFTEKKQALHDMMASCLVMKK